MILQSKFVWLFIIIGGMLLPPMQSLRFDLLSGHTKCIAEDIKSNSMSVGKYSVINPQEGHPIPPSHKITVRVTSSIGNSYHHAEQVDSGQFAYTAVEAGDYMVCFTAVDHRPEVPLTIDLEWKSGVHAKDWSKVAKKGQVEFALLPLVKGHWFHGEIVRYLCVGSHPIILYGAGKDNMNSFSRIVLCSGILQREDPLLSRPLFRFYFLFLYLAIISCGLEFNLQV